MENFPAGQTVYSSPTKVRCVCCGESYTRGHFRCCAPPNGSASEVWLSKFCPVPDRGGCGKCPRHCLCERVITVTPVKGWKHAAAEVSRDVA